MSCHEYEWLECASPDNAGSNRPTKGHEAVSWPAMCLVQSTKALTYIAIQYSVMFLILITVILIIVGRRVWVKIWEVGGCVSAILLLLYCMCWHCSHVQREQEFIDDVLPIIFQILTLYSAHSPAVWSHDKQNQVKPAIVSIELHSNFLLHTGFSFHFLFQLVRFVLFTNTRGACLFLWEHVPTF